MSIYLCVCVHMAFCAHARVCVCAPLTLCVCVCVCVCCVRVHPSMPPAPPSPPSQSRGEQQRTQVIGPSLSLQTDRTFHHGGISLPFPKPCHPSDAINTFFILIFFFPTLLQIGRGRKMQVSASLIIPVITPLGKKTSVCSHRENKERWRGRGRGAERAIAGSLRTLHPTPTTTTTTTTDSPSVGNAAQPTAAWSHPERIWVRFETTWRFEFFLCWSSAKAGTVVVEI